VAGEMVALIPGNYGVTSLVG